MVTNDCDPEVKTALSISGVSLTTAEINYLTVLFTKVIWRKMSARVNLFQNVSGLAHTAEVKLTYSPSSAAVLQSEMSDYYSKGLFMDLSCA